MNPHAYKVNWLSKLANLKEVYVKSKIESIARSKPFGISQTSTTNKRSIAN